jgi:hypothetical protein
MNSRFNKIHVLKENSRFHYYLRSAPFVSNPVGIAGTDLLRVELLYGITAPSALSRTEPNSAR